MSQSATGVELEYLPFFVTAPGESDTLFTATVIFLVLVAIGFGALYFTIQAIPDRLANSASKVQLQIVGLLGLLSLFTMNNAYWVAALLLAAVRIPDLVTPLRDISRAMLQRERVSDQAQGSVPPGGQVPSDEERESPAPGEHDRHD